MFQPLAAAGRGRIGGTVARYHDVVTCIFTATVLSVSTNRVRTTRALHHVRLVAWFHGLDPAPFCGGVRPCRWVNEIRLPQAPCPLLKANANVPMLLKRHIVILGWIRIMVPGSAHATHRSLGRLITEAARVCLLPAPAVLAHVLDGQRGFPAQHALRLARVRENAC